MNISITAIQQAKLYNMEPGLILYHWTGFCEYATLEGISLVDEDDWFDWWRIYIHAAAMEANRAKENL